MILLIYKNGLCDPENNHGLKKRFGSAKETDAFINAFVASIDLKFLSNYRIFIVNKEEEMTTVDHYVLMNEDLPGAAKTWIEVDVKEKAREVHKQLRELESQQEQRMKRAKRDIDKAISKMGGT